MAHGQLFTDPELDYCQCNWKNMRLAVVVVGMNISKANMAALID